MFKDVARQFARDVIIPQAAELDRSMKFPHAIFNQVFPERITYIDNSIYHNECISDRIVIYA